MNFLKKLGILIFWGVVLFSVLSFSSTELIFEYENAKIKGLKASIGNFFGIAKVDSSRALVIRKVMNIAGKYNKKLSYDEKYAIANEIYKMSVKYENLDADLICATISHESAFTWSETVVSRAGALGLMQIMPYTGRFLSRHEGIEWTDAEGVLFNPINNIRMGCRYLSSLIELYQIDGGLAAYNGGERQAAKWLASGRNNDLLVEETREYVPAILKLYKTYQN